MVLVYDYINTVVLQSRYAAEEHKIKEKEAKKVDKNSPDTREENRREALVIIED